MKQLRIRFRITAIIVISLLLGSAFYGIYSVNVYGNRWISSSKNSRYLDTQSSVIPGNIIDRNNIVVAATDEEGKRIYQSDPLSRASLVHLLGDSEGNIANGVESFQANALLGMNASFFERVASLFSKDRLHGDNIQLTIDSRLSTYIAAAWRDSKVKDNCGAVVVLNYKTGEILSMVSIPIYDPQNITQQVRTSSTYPFWNRCTQSQLPPGSTFKIITAAAAFENITDVEKLEYHCTGHLLHDYGNEVHGKLDIRKAFRLSCNNTFAQIALDIGDAALRKTAEDFGFNDNFLFRDLVLENSSYPTKNRNEYELKWSGVGQSQILATPMHMCMVAGAIANNGLMMEPQLVKKVISPSGKVRQTFSAREYRIACDTGIAGKIQEFMKEVVKSGTGTKAQVDGLTIAGKTGSAESNINGKYTTHGWFTGYIAQENKPYAVCVMVESGGSGGTVAAPIAKKVFQYLDQNY